MPNYQKETVASSGLICEWIHISASQNWCLKSRAFKNYLPETSSIHVV